MNESHVSYGRIVESVATDMIKEIGVRVKKILTLITLVVLSSVAVADTTIEQIMDHFRDNPEEALRRIRYAVETLGADVNGGVKDGDFAYTPLCLATNVEIAKELVRLGAIPRGRGNDELSLLECAVWFGRDLELFPWIVNDLMQDPNAIRQGRTALCWAARHRDVESVSALLRLGADPNVYDTTNPGTHPLACALANRSPWEQVVIPVLDALTSANAKLP